MGLSFRELTESDAEMVGRWRSSERVSKFLNTDVEFNLVRQIEWIKNSFSRSDYYHWILSNNGEPVGHVQICQIDLKKKSAQWGFFIGEESALGLGAFVPPLVYSFCFNELGLEYLEAEVLHINSKVIALHQIHGYQFAPELDKVVIKNEKEFLSVGMKLQSHKFIGSKFDREKAEFPITSWVGCPFALEATD
ncbi:UDP-4-amino-4,6-dideoxy-N-acetyl-beta-L-altrosamine N-acetyltransferase [Aurantimicrobium minutum]|uniref:GNAT family N-acetyltransferase n=1 Tax=Aurantimicrobium minutum TaxID=708131 RepID=UPI002476F9EB|nr:GNAT family N-acetyltransferase [Aurantimicrobium minutum]MDH6533358.1 UDP-4-amino-4,6-dideoxy-N-acetyl-beta-L-altrosamine N-acetyltransferase [Aurantimicrobium minutum]